LSGCLTRPLGRLAKALELRRIAGFRNRSRAAHRRMYEIQATVMLPHDLLHGKVSRLVAFQNAPRIDANLAVRITEAAAIAHQAAGEGELMVLEDRGYRVAARQCRELFHAPIIEGAGADQGCTNAVLRKKCEGGFEIAVGSGINDSQLQASVRAAACKSAMMDWVAGKAGSTSTPNRVALGINSRSNCNRFGASSAFKTAMPVTFAPGRLRLATSPNEIGSPPVAKTIGMVVVADFAASAAGVPLVAITATRRRIRSAASADSRSIWFSRRIVHWLSA
jgi:hypothetical protein